MKIAITTPTGNIGSKIADSLVGGEHKITLLVRDAKKVEPLIVRGAKVLEGSLADAGYVREATKGAEMLFWISPPDPSAKDGRRQMSGLGKTAAAAIQANRIVQVVHLTSVGAQHDSGTGPIAGLHDVEELLNKTGAYITHLRAGYFFENYLAALESIKNDGAIYFPVSGSTRLPMVATKDIADVAVKLLTDKSWRGRTYMGVHGPCDLSFDEAAAAISAGIGKKVKHVPIEPEQYRKGLFDYGLSESFANMVVEMYGAFESGLISAQEPRTKETTTPTMLEEFAREVIKPALTEKVPS